MPISAMFSLKDLAEALTAEEIDDIGRTGGAFDGSDTWYTYWTVNDDRVRPSHAALHGTVWRVDDPKAPTPPLAYGCRCFIEYCAAPDSVMAKVIPEAEAEPVSKAVAYVKYLGAAVEDWKSLAKEAMALAPPERIPFLVESLKDDGHTGYIARELANMIMVAASNG